MMSIYKKYTRDNAGFSFAELMVVIALIGVLSAIALPNLLRSLPEKRVKNAARNLYADMQQARMLAVKENRDIVVRFTGNFYYFDDNNDGNYTANEFRRNLSEDGDVSYGSGGTSTNWSGNSINPNSLTPITFRSTGGASQGSTYLQNQNQDVCYAITTTMYGAVKIRRFNGAKWDED